MAVIEVVVEAEVVRIASQEEIEEMMDIAIQEETIIEDAHDHR